MVAACTADGIALAEDDLEKLLRLPATVQDINLYNNGEVTLQADLEARKTALLRDINQRNLGYFEHEVQKLDVWADDLKLGLEQEIKVIDREIKEVRRTAATSSVLEEKLSWQKRQRGLESKRSSLRRSCSRGRTKSKPSITRSSISWKCNFSSRLKSARYLLSNGS